MRVALFGGSFNPPHIGHQLLAFYVLETSDVDELWFVPCWKHPFDKELEDFAHRLRMTELAAAALGARARVSDFESKLGGDKSRTLLTVRGLQAQFPQHQFRLLIGSDLEPELPSWYGAEELRRSVPLQVVGRGGYPGRFPVSMPLVSSTEIRNRLRTGESAQGMVCASVLAYIREHGLYAR